MTGLEDLDVVAGWAADGWHVVVQRKEGGRWRRHRLVGWALVRDEEGGVQCVGLVPVGTEVRPAGRQTGHRSFFQHVDDWPSCSCDEAVVERQDLGMCVTCAGTVDGRTRAVRAVQRPRLRLAGDRERAR